MVVMIKLKTNYSKLLVFKNHIMTVIQRISLNPILLQFSLLSFLSVIPFVNANQTVLFHRHGWSKKSSLSGGGKRKRRETG